MALSTSPPRAKMQLTKRGLQQFSLWPLRSAPGSLGTYGFLTPPYGLPYGLELKNNPRLCTSLRVYASNTPQEAATLILGALPHKCGVRASLGTPHLCGSEASKRELPGSESQNGELLPLEGREKSKQAVSR